MIFRPPRGETIGVAHAVWRCLPADARRAAAVHGAALLAPRPARDPPNQARALVIAGLLAQPNGLGASARILASALALAGVETQRLDTGKRRDDAREIGPLRDGAALVLHVNPPSLPGTLVRLPRALLRGRRTIGYWAWELPSVPPLWHVGPRFVHEVWAPSTFTAAAFAPFAEAGLPVRVVPIPLGADPPRPAQLGRAAFGLPEHALVTLVAFDLASSFERKNPLAAIAAHRAAFGERRDRLLLLKIGNPGHFPADMRRLRDAVGGLPNVRVETRTFPLADNHALTANADIVVSLHRSEGFGLVPAEAMLLGRAVIATGWSGNMDFMDDTSAVLVAPRLIPAVDPRRVFMAPGARWADPDPEEAAAHLRRLAADADARRTLGERARAMASARLGTQGLARAVNTLGVHM